MHPPVLGVLRNIAVGWRQAWELIQTVLPFHSVTFRSGAAQRQSRAVLDVLDKCAHRLLYELKMEGLATGLDVHVEVSPLHLSYLSLLIRETAFSAEAQWCLYTLPKCPCTDLLCDISVLC